MTCHSCGVELPHNAKFCPECGTAVAVRACPACGIPAERGRFCMACGTPIDATHARATPATAQPVTERKVTSVLFGDLVGFTTLSESRDAEDVRELLSAYFERCRTVIGRYGGTVEKFIGDAVMAVWGVPIAHEDDAERAVRAGLEIVTAIADMGADLQAPDLAMRVGIVTGEVAVTLGATGQGMVAGDAVNTAARVQSAATPGRVWVDDTTRSLSSAAISFADAGAQIFKGKTEPVQLWEAGTVVADVGGRHRMDGLEAPLIARERELRLVKELFHAADESGRPRLVVIDGEPGVGKSRLAWEFEKYTDGLTASTWWHRGRCLAYGDGVAFWALAETVQGRLGVAEGDDRAVIAQKLDQALERFVPDRTERDWLRPRLAVLVGVGGSGFAREDLFAAWTAFFEYLAADTAGDGAAPVVLVIDDAQHADEGLLDFLEHLLNNATGAVFVLALARPELLARRPDLGGRRTIVIRLDPLDDAAMGRLVEGLVEGLPPATRTALVGRAEGIPLFAVETIRTLVDREAVIRRNGRYVPADGVEVDLDAIGAPASLQALIAARLDALDPTERRVVTDASVLGAAFTGGGLASLAADVDDLDSVLESLRRKEIIVLTTDRFSAEAGQYRFVQSMVRQVAYGTQSRRDRKRRHLLAADYLSGEQEAADLAVVIAQHLLDAIDASGEKDSDRDELARRALALLEAGAARARALGSHIEAQRHLEKALDRAASMDPAVLARIHHAAAGAALDAGDYAGTIDHAKMATKLFDQLEQPVEAGRAAATHAMALSWLGDNGGAIGIAQPRWEVLQARGDADTALLALANCLAFAHAGLGRYHDMAPYADRAMLIAEAANDLHSLSRAMRQMARCYSVRGAQLSALALTQAAAQIARDQGLWDALAMALGIQVSIQLTRDLAGALANSEQGMAAARRGGVRATIDTSLTNQLLAHWVAGRLAEARNLLSSSADEPRDPTLRLALRGISRWINVAAGSQQDDPASAELEDVESFDDAYSLAWAGHTRMLQALDSGNTAAAARIAERTLPHVLAAFDLADEFVFHWPALVLAALADGDADLAERLMGPVSMARAALPPYLDAQRLRLRGLVRAARGDDPAEIEADLSAGVRGLASFGAAGDAARAEEDLAFWLASQRRTEEAELLLAHVRASYEEMDARGWLAQLDNRSRLEH
ncbi:adenylate/guanylate cyclase domain-containing protein [Wenzhouxiangella sp. XN24]|uniref:adenylate/guanylate cyclase domain-containing protein n=1 Tax=Wenzhouxiangella sp. XN24 TaxID=2713569 RepID=UPI0013E9E2C1|nr:adenylate/guanylate cyclase domain-containing protein [Wenzhouxiangella sp. XN24]NGX16100.1 AAA family ATPase [Wenzhouxiangella sp. XN24]